MAMSYNIRLNTTSDGGKAWAYRRDFLDGQVLFHAPDVVGIQEGLPAGTFSGFDYNTPATRRIDYIFASPPTKVSRFATLTGTIDGRYRSNHFAVISTLHLRPRR